VIGIAVLRKAAISRKLDVERLFYCFSVLVVFGRTRQGPQGRRFAFPVLQPVQFRPPRLQSEGGSFNELKSEHIMSSPLRKPSVKLVHGRATTTSVKIAESFGKLHKNVLRAIENLECSPEFNRLNFEPIEYTDAAGRKYPMYNITRDGFAFLASGFTGKEAAHWKERFIEAFNHLEQKVLEKATAKQIPKAVTTPKRYNYPRKLLEQAYFITPQKTAKLNLSMLACRNFSSPLMSLLADLETDGHDVTAPRDELIALREALVNAEESFNEIWQIALGAQHKPASTAGK